MNNPIIKYDNGLGVLFLLFFLPTIYDTIKAIIAPINRKSRTGPQDNDIHSGFAKATAEKNTSIPTRENNTCKITLLFLAIVYDGYTNKPVLI